MSQVFLSAMANPTAAKDKMTNDANKSMGIFKFFKVTPLVPDFHVNCPVLSAIVSIYENFRAVK